MRRRKLRLLIMGVAVSVAAPLGAVGLSASQASADITTGLPAPYVTSVNGSDPDAEPCTYNGQNGYCLYTSQDMNMGKDSHGNYYPMNQTMGYFSTDGKYWVSHGAVFNESQYVAMGWTPYTPNGANHLWAPDVTYANGQYRLLDPDVSDLNNESTSSFIGVSTSSSPFGPFTPVAQLKGNPSVNSGYASDPNVVNGGDGRRYLVYADGDASNCGGLSIGWMSNDLTKFHTSWPKQLTIIGAGVLGSCGGTGYPYMEGPSLYYTPSWNMPGVPGPYLLEFAAKPTSTPVGCQGHGEPGTDNEVIAYATADSAAGPYFYQGILMCGSSLEWTDQASIIPMTANSGDQALILVYHDSSTPDGPPQNRTLHAEALMYGGGKIAAAIRTGGTQFPDSGAYGILQSFNPYTFALMDQSGDQPVVSTLVNQYGQLDAARIATGSWEQYQLRDGGPRFNAYEIKPLISQGTAIDGASIYSIANGSYVTAESSGSYLAANSGTVGTNQKYDVLFNQVGTGTMLLTAESDGLLVRSSSGYLLADATPPGGTDYFLLHY